MRPTVAGIGRMSRSWGRTGHAGMPGMTRMTVAEILRRGTTLSIQPIPVTPSKAEMRYSAFVTKILLPRVKLIREQLQAPPHKHSEKFRSVPSIASTIEHIGESRFGARDQSCIRPAIGTQTPWHDICWLQLSLGTSEAFPVRICKRSPGVSFTDQDDAIGRQFLRG
jgi:hypothetical protein